uniref:fibulin-5-like isoform X2 n=1 Tax=Myxine glutinosa TaxID=7769 RepID=UPI00358E1191
MSPPKKMSPLWMATPLGILLLFSLCHFSCSQHSEGLSQDICPDGYDFNPERNQCEDRNECEMIPDACKGTLKCLNHFGGYMCLPRTAQLFVTTQALTENTFLERVAIEREREARPLPSTQAGIPQRSSNRRPAVFGGSSSSSWSTRPPTPVPSARAPVAPLVQPHRTDGTELVSSQQITCRAGLSPDATGKCVDIDECAGGLHQCRPPHECVNAVGSYTCQCPSGFRNYDRHCVDINECHFGYCSHDCVNTPGSYYCQCNLGFALTADNLSCVDVDECLGNTPCSQRCFNLYGSFMCRCNSGYELESDQRTCRDVDECSLSRFLCQHECVNEPGAYRCSCPHGYLLHTDTSSCRDVNECDDNVHNCSVGDTCFNINGGYRCTPQLTCQAPYTLISENRCVCPSEIPVCQDRAYIVLHKYMQILSERTAPTDVFQMQATSQYLGAYYTFRISSSNEGGEFMLRQTGPVTAMLMLTRPIKGPRDIVLDLEMLTRNTVMNIHGSSIIRLTIFVTGNSF